MCHATIFFSYVTPHKTFVFPQILTDLEQEPLPDDLDVIRTLITEHQEFMDGLSARQPEIDAVCKPMRPKSTAPSSRRTSKIGRTPG